MIKGFIKIYDRDISRLKEEIEAFAKEENLWRVTGAVKNPAGNLCLHLVGNLRTYIGKNLGGFDYVRDRNAEFELKDISKHQLLSNVEDTKSIVISSLQKLDNTVLKHTYVEDVLGYSMTNGFFLIHLSAHLSYHLGQINYLRRMIDSSEGSTLDTTRSRQHGTA